LLPASSSLSVPCPCSAPRPTGPSTWAAGPSARAPRGMAVCGRSCLPLAAATASTTSQNGPETYCSLHYGGLLPLSPRLTRTGYADAAWPLAEFLGFLFPRIADVFDSFCVQVPHIAPVISLHNAKTTPIGICFFLRPHTSNLLILWFSFFNSPNKAVSLGRSN